MTQIQAINKTIAQLTKKEVEDLNYAADHNLVRPESLVWLLLDLFEDGVMRSRAYSDVPQVVIYDGLVTQRVNPNIAFTGWSFTEKAQSILAKRNK